MFKITNEWLMQHRTKKGGWTKSQAEVLFLQWPLWKGWKHSMIGNSITNTDRVNFESAAHITCKNSKFETFNINSCLKYLWENHKNFDGEQYLEIKYLLVKLSNRL